MDKFFVGQKAVLERTFSLDEVTAYAQLTGDDNPFHVDTEFARQSRFGNNIVHGMFVMGVISKILGTILPGNGSIYLGQEVKFKSPVYVDEKTVFEVEIEKIETERKIICLATKVYDKEGKCLVEGTARILYEG